MPQSTQRAQRGRSKKDFFNFNFSVFSPVFSVISVSSVAKFLSSELNYGTPYMERSYIVRPDNIPVTLYPAEQRSELHFNLIDDRNKAKVKYQRVNERTGEEVPWDNIVKGYEYEENEYVLLGDADFKQADIKATQTVELEDFVSGRADRGRIFRQALLPRAVESRHQGLRAARETLKKTKKMGVARVVIRTRDMSRPCSQRPRAVLDLLRYDEELRKESDYDFPAENIEEYHLSNREIEMAERFIESMTSKWQPEKYKDQYRERLMAWIEKKAKSGMVQGSRRA